MYIKRITIKSFGALTDRVIDLERGLNVFYGANESGKSTVATFIKFVLYGLSGKGGADAISEKEHYINWENDLASGSLSVECSSGEYTIERRLYRTREGQKDIYREGVKILNVTTGEVVKTTKSPGEYFFGFPEKVFSQSAYVKSVDSAKIDGGGLKVALENLMTSGDEEINTKRAIDRLDQARKLLRYKNGTGGKIGDLESERARLLELLDDSKNVSRRVVDLEGTLADVAAKRAEREAEERELSALCRGYEAIRIGAKVKSIEQCEAEVDKIGKELDALDPEIGDELLAKIDICRTTVIDTEADIETLRAKKAELEEKKEGRDTEAPPSVDEVMSELTKYKRGGTFCLSAACTFAVFAVIGLIMAVYPGFRGLLVGSGYVGIIIVMTVMFAMLSAAGFVLNKYFSSSLDRLLGKWEVEDEDELESAVLAKHDSYKYTGKLAENISRIDSITEEAITKHDREIDRGMAYGERLGVEMSDNVFEVLDRAKEAVCAVCEKRRELTLRLESAKGRLSAIVEDIGDEERGGAAEAEREALNSPLRDRILAMTKDEYNSIVRQRDFAASTASSLKEREATIEKDLAALGAAGKTPSEIAGRITVVDREIENLTMKHTALVTALEALERAGEKMRGDVMPRVAADAAKIMGSVTDGRYDSLSSGESFELSVTAGGERRPLDFLSEGTKDAAYLSVRAALVNVMYGEETPVMIFDECFARLDKERLGVMMRILSSDDMPQSLVFTCRKDEAEFAEANTITL